MRRLGSRSESAETGRWWEVDFIIAFLLGTFALGLFAMIEIFNS